jgi:uncharacterized membrane protein YozB (DUF420 family)
MIRIRNDQIAIHRKRVLNAFMNASHLLVQYGLFVQGSAEMNVIGCINSYSLVAARFGQKSNNSLVGDTF